MDIDLVQANELDEVDAPDSSQFFIMGIKDTNSGVILSYPKLAEALLNQLFSEDMPEDGMKLYIVE